MRLLFLFISVTLYIHSKSAGNIVKIVAFGEGKCKDTTHWFTSHFLPTWRLFGDSGRLNFEYHPYGIKTSCSEKNGRIECKCHHGDDECELNYLQSCVIENLPNSVEYIEYIGCIQGRQNMTEALDICFNSRSNLARNKFVEIRNSFPNN